MKRIIYIPANGEVVPDGAVFYTLPSSRDVVDVIVPDAFTTAGEILHDTQSHIALNEPFIHHFAGWEV